MSRYHALRGAGLLLLFGQIPLLVAHYEDRESDRHGDMNQYTQVSPSFEIIRETRSDAGAVMWTAIVLMPKEQYSRKNLDSLFCSYCKQHPDKNERLQVRVYTAPEDIPNSGSPTPPSEHARERALFWRQGDGVAAYGGRNEEYFYHPDPDNLSQFKRVVLRGTSWAARRTILKSSNLTRGRIRIRASAYELDSIDPPGVYHCFESFDSRWKEWRTIITFQQEGEILSLSDKVNFIDPNICYISIGPVFAVTLDAGRTWSTWDAGRDLEGVACFDKVSIERLTIDRSGKGFISLRLSGTEGTKTFWTEDFGTHWLER